VLSMPDSQILTTPLPALRMTLFSGSGTPLQQWRWQDLLRCCIPMLRIIRAHGCGTRPGREAIRPMIDPLVSPCAAKPPIGFSTLMNLLLRP